MNVQIKDADANKHKEIGKCLSILREIKDVAFATVDEEGFPQVRIIDIMIVEEDKLYFCTGRGKDFYRQLMRNGNVAVTGLNKDFQTVRLMGKAERLEEQKYWIDRIFDENPSMNDVYPGQSRYILEAFCIESGVLEFFDLGKNPIFRESFVFGNDNNEGNIDGKSCNAIKEKGFLITDKCIGCGKCRRGCPQQCIAEGKPYALNQNNCLHCGLCFENCPVNAIIRKG